MYRIAIIPKVKRSIEYSNAFGSQHDYKHIKYCMEDLLKKKSFHYEIVYLDSFFFKSRIPNYLNKKYDGLIFIGVNNTAKKIIPILENLDVFIWSFNQIEWSNKSEFLNYVDMVFEQSARPINNFNNKKIEVYYTPLGFQNNINNITNPNPKYDIVFNGTLDRSRRTTAKFHRRDILHGLLKKNIKILNYNGRSTNAVERELLKPLKLHKNFKCINSFGEPSNYNDGKFSLNLPFHELGSLKNLDINWGMSKYDLENGNWIIHWDIFRCIGSKSNMITFDCPESRALGLNNNNCNFYINDTTNIDGIINEIEKIVKSSTTKVIDDKCWYNNTYANRWNFIFEKIEFYLNNKKIYL